jgi:hypothetical protein
MSKKEDLKMGEINESKHIDTLCEKFETELIKDTNKFSIMDWSNKSATVYAELKSRRVNHNTYPTAIVGLNKINFCNDSTKTYYFAFSYQDGLYYIKFNKELFKTFEIKNMKISYRGDVGRTEVNDVIHIPVNLLTKI